MKYVKEEYSNMFGIELKSKNKVIASLDVDTILERCVLPKISKRYKYERQIFVKKIEKL